MTQAKYKAAILDMDGVVTQTARVHARAWKRTFDEFLASREQREDEAHDPFDIVVDYRRYVDGKPRYDGVASFLTSRNIDLPYGEEGDEADRQTVCGLGNRKNALFRELIERDGVEVYDDTVEQVKEWKREGIKVAVISASRNCEAVLRAAGVLDLFDAKVDGNDIARNGLDGKPAPDCFLRAAALLGVEPEEAIVVEDAIAGVEAGRRGDFGLVVGVARGGGVDALREAGADCVVSDLGAFQTARRYCPPGEDCLSRPVSAIEHAEWITSLVRDEQLALFLDYDGTLTPIVRRPEDATLTDRMRSLLSELAEQTTVAIVSGRDRRNVEEMVGVEHLAYAGSHGFDIRGPGGLQMEQEDAQQALPELDDAERALVGRIEPITGARVERKKFAIAVHYREVQSDEGIAQVESAVDEVLAGHAGLRKRGGKKIFELQPDVEWDKGHAVLWLTKALGLDHPGVVVIYIGDDVTDEDAFRALRDRGKGIGIRVAEPTSRTDALYYLRDCEEVSGFLQSLLQALSSRNT